MVYLCSSFSLAMLTTLPARISIEPIDDRSALAILLDATDMEQLVSAVGHQSTADMISGRLGLAVPVNRVSSPIRPGDTVIVAQYLGPRLPEGATTLPEGATIQFMRVQYTD